MAILTFRTFATSYRETGFFIGLRFGRLFSQDIWVLALSDAVLVGTTVLCVPFIKLVQLGWIRYHYTGVVIQHLAQTAFLALAIRWTFHREWPWVQTGCAPFQGLSSRSS